MPRTAAAEAGPAPPAARDRLGSGGADWYILPPDMLRFPRIPLAARRLLLGAFVLYLFGLLGYLAPAHRHVDGDGRSGTHQDCQLCQVGHQPFVAPDAAACPETPAGPVALVEAVWAPILASRYQPFASRAPPSA